MRILCLIFAIPSAGITAIFAAGINVNYKKLSMYSYNPKFGALYYHYRIKERKLTNKNAVKMFKYLREGREEYVKEYNSIYQTGTSK